MRTALFLAVLGTSLGLAAAPAPSSTAFPVTIKVDVAKTLGPLDPIWRFFGADEPNYATEPNGRILMHELGALRPGQVYFRAHNLLTTGDGTPSLKWGSTNAYTEDGDGDPVYNWTILDGIFDTYRDSGVRPYVEIGFMPKALSIHPEPYRHRWEKTHRLFTGWAYPPKNYRRWGDLVYHWVRHCVERYGKAAVEQWYWEVWNEPNIGYWQGTREQFYKLHDYAIDAVRRALPDARVGGPDCAGDGGEWMREFLRHCLYGTNLANGLPGTPLDFVSFHAKGKTAVVDGHLQMGVAHELRTIDRGFGIIRSFPELRHTPVVIGECDPESCAACRGLKVGYRNGSLYASYTAESFVRIMDLARQRDVNLRGALTWAFEFENQPIFTGLRTLATDGVDKPVLNVFRMFSLMGGQRVAVTSSGELPLATVLADGVRGKPDVAALASLQSGRLCVLVWHYHDDDVAGPAADVSLTLHGLPAMVHRGRLTHFRIDATHSNAFTVWKRMGSPAKPTAKQYARLVAAGQLQRLTPDRTVALVDGKATLTFTLPRQAVSLLVLDWQ